MIKNFEKIKNTIKEAHGVAVVSHHFPDGDAIGSTVALASTIELAFPHLKNKVQMWNNNSVPRRLQIIKGSENIQPIPDKIPEGIDLIFVVDCAKLSRCGEKAANLLKNAKVIGIDHHEGDYEFSYSTTRFADSASCAEIIKEYCFDLLGDKANYPKEDIAKICEALYVGMSTDTKGITVNVSSDFLKTLADVSLYIIPGRIDEINKTLYGSYTKEEIDFIKYIFTNMETQDNVSKLVVTKFYKETHKLPEDFSLSFFASRYGLMNEEIKLAVFIEELDFDKIRISFRSRSADEFNVDEIAKKIGGGGHPCAAGALVNMSLTRTQSKIKEILDNYEN